MRFERLLAASPAVRRSVVAWERRLVPLTRAVEPSPPPADTWRNIAVRLGLGRPEPVRASGLWPALAAALAVVALALGTLYFTKQPSVTTADYVAIVTDADIGPVWVLQTFIAPAELHADTINERPAPANSDYELWMLPDDGTAPVSLGLIPGAGQAVLPLAAVQLEVLEQTSTLAVSVEPAGGSPTGAPTGPVIYTAPLLRT
jgi:anti-sigma-K factor RskA